MRALFVGGPWHGRVESLPPDTWQWEVPVGGDASIFDDSPVRGLQTVTYARRRTWVGGVLVSAFSLDIRPPETRQILDAFVIATKLGD